MESLGKMPEQASVKKFGKKPIKKAQATFGGAGGGVIMVWLAGLLGLDISPTVAAMLVGVLASLAVYLKGEPIIAQAFEIVRRRQRQQLEEMQD